MMGTNSAFSMSNQRGNDEMGHRKNSTTPNTVIQSRAKASGLSQTLKRNSSQTDQNVSTRTHKPFGTANQKKR